MTTFSHSRIVEWGKLYKLHFWRWGITLDWGYHRVIFGSSKELTHE